MAADVFDSGSSGLGIVTKQVPEFGRARLLPSWLSGSFALPRCAELESIDSQFRKPDVARRHRHFESTQPHGDSQKGIVSQQAFAFWLFNAIPAF